MTTDKRNKAEKVAKSAGEVTLKTRKKEESHTGIWERTSKGSQN